MPWKQTNAMDQRVKFIADWLSQNYTKIELCRAHGISRPTADKMDQALSTSGSPGARGTLARAEPCARSKM